MIHCTNCGHANAEGASQCEACYDTLPALTSCPTCQTSVPDDAFFCPQCGASLPRGVSHQGNTPSDSGESPALTAPPAFNELPATNVVAQEALGASSVPATDVVSSPEADHLPPTNVVHPNSLPSRPDLPPTNVVHVPSPSDLPPTNVVHVPPPPDLPPTNVVPLDNIGAPAPPVDDGSSTLNPPVAETMPPQAPPPAPEPEEVDEIETVPTMVVSPGANRDVIESVPAQETPPQPPAAPEIPPTMPPQSPFAYQGPPVVEPIVPEVESVPPPPLDPPPADPLPVDPLPVDSPVMDSPVVDSFPPFEVPAETTVQPYPPASGPTVGETVIQLPQAQLIHERSDARLILPTQAVILIGKATDTIEPDLDISSLLDSHVVSRRHAAIFMEAGAYSIEDLGSSNGTYVNDEPCGRGNRVAIKPGDRICLGRENKVSFIFEIS